tara:strand:+ start:1701 stop:3143 length:1443 start_codon:yes stop_codon:yes gene_type:complete
MKFWSQTIKIVILFTLLINIFFNEYTLVYFTIDNDISILNKIKIRIFNSIIFLIPVIYFLFRLIIKNNFLIIKKIYIYFGTVLISFLLIFLFLTLAQNFNQRINNKYQNENLSFIHPSKVKNLSFNFLSQIYPNYSKEEIQHAVNEVELSGHPILEYITSPNNNDFYAIGPEGARLSKFVNNENFFNILNDSIWMFGGSTTFGTGVKKNETITFFLNKHDKKNTYINFGTPSYSQNSEIKKLLLLLNKGFKPKKVLFLDGLNDIDLLGRDNFNPIEQPDLLSKAYSFYYNLDTFLNNLFLRIKLSIYSNKFLSFIPKKLDNINFNKSRKNINENYIDVYEKNLNYHTNPFLSFQFSNVNLNINAQYNKIFYKWNLNNNFLKNLSLGFDFDYYIFLQPIGHLSEQNPFINDFEAFKQSELYNIYFNIYNQLIKDIDENRLNNYYNISKADNNCKNCYVDLGHYNAELNEEISKAILIRLKN